MLRVPGHHCSSVLGVSKDYFYGDLFQMICKCLRKAEKNKVTSIAIPLMTGESYFTPVRGDKCYLLN